MVGRKFISNLMFVKRVTGSQKSFQKQTTNAGISTGSFSNNCVSDFLTAPFARRHFCTECGKPLVSGRATSQWSTFTRILISKVLHYSKHKPRIVSRWLFKLVTALFTIYAYICLFLGVEYHLAELPEERHE
jgi:hypothetical protein